MLKSVFLELLLLCNHEPVEFNGKKIAKGQIIIDIESMESLLNIPIGNIDISLNQLAVLGEITIEEGDEPIITINNFNQYIYV